MHISLQAEELFGTGQFIFTNTLALSLLALVFLVGGAAILKRRLALVPGGFQNIAEIGIEFIIDLMDQVLGDRKKSEKYLPLVATIFIFVLVSNWLGLLPGIGSIVLRHGDESVPLLRSPSTDLNFTLALAIISVVAANAIGVAAAGFFRYMKKYLDFSGPLAFFVGILELISEIAKLISFSFRLFGNIFAGEVLLVVLGILVPYLLPVPFIMMEMFFGFIQALIFATLTLVFIAVASEHH